MEIIIGNHRDDLNKKVYEIIKTTIDSNPDSNLGLPTGGTPLGLYKIMREDFARGNLSYKNVSIINLDEYVGISRKDRNSYYQFMKTNLIDDLDIKPENFHIPDGTNVSLEFECKRYEKVLIDKPRDIQVLGIGINGHIGFNEPYTSFNSTTRIVELSSETRLANARFFKSLKDVPTHAITMGIKNILEAKKIIIMAFGLNKAQAIADMIEKQPSEICPASALKNHQNLVVIIDKEAASKLSKTTMSKANKGLLAFD
ncbi:MAG: glucosamine-6-phosphate deaminase [Candidatus Izemoplasmatales bacterium]